MQYHLKKGTLVLLPGNLAGIVLDRICASYYNVLVEDTIHKIHRDDMVEVENDSEDEE